MSKNDTCNENNNVGSGPTTSLQGKAFSFETYFGATLLTKDGIKSTKEVLANKKYVGIYFSASWCPPCRGFTPLLAEFYEMLQSEDGNEDSLEIIFASSDKDETEFDAYYKKMPWLSLPFAQRGVKDALSQLFSVRGIPTLVIITHDGLVKDVNGRATIASCKGDSQKALQQWESTPGGVIGGAAPMKKKPAGCSIQ